MSRCALASLSGAIRRTAVRASAQSLKVTFVKPTQEKTDQSELDYRTGDASSHPAGTRHDPVPAEQLSPGSVAFWIS